MTATFDKHTAQLLPLLSLEPHPKIQRAFIAARAKKFAEAFDRDIFGALIVVRRRGNTYWIVDGQHRWAAAKEALGEKAVVPCQIYDVPENRQAQLFLGVNDAKPVRSLDRWPVRAISKDPLVLVVNEILKMHNLRVSDFKKQPGNIRAVAALETVMRRYGPEVLDRVLTVAGRAWGQDLDAYDGFILRGLASVLSRTQPSMDEEMARKLGRRGSASGLVGRARDRSRIIATDMVTAMDATIVDIYDDSRRKDKIGHKPSVKSVDAATAKAPAAVAVLSPAPLRS